MWGADRPCRPNTPVIQLDVKYTGEEALDKYKRVAEKLDGTVDKLLVTTLDDICWLLNCRGTDIDYNPVFFSYVLFTPATLTVKLYIDPEKVEGIKNYLDNIKVTVQPYERIDADLKEVIEDENVKIGITEECNGHLGQIVKDNKVVLGENPIAYLKCEKNEVEQAGMRACNIRDCAAIMKYFAYLEKELKNPSHTLTEYTGAMYLDKLRTYGDLHKGPSFATISSIGPNGAVIHYEPEEPTALKLNNTEIYLLDSGGQYLDGTTDITRTT